MKKIYMLVIGLFILSIVGAGVISTFNLTPVVFDKPISKTSLTPDQITFDCGAEKGIVIEVLEPDGRFDENDIYSAITSVCSESISNIKMNNLLYKQNKYGR